MLHMLWATVLCALPRLDLVDGASMPSVGLSQPLELAVLCLVVVLAVRFEPGLSEGFRARLSHLASGLSLFIIVIEAALALLAYGGEELSWLSALPDVIVIAISMLLVLAIALDLVLVCCRHSVSNGDEDRTPSTPILAVTACFLLSGLFWRLALVLVRTVSPSWSVVQLGSVVLASFACALPPFMVALGLNSSRRDVVLVMLAPVAGSLLGETIAQLLRAGGGFEGVAVIVPYVLSVPVLISATAGLLAWKLFPLDFSMRPDEGSAEPSRERHDSADWSSTLHLLDGAEALTERESRVLELSLRHMKTHEIAHELGVAPSTVATYRSRALTKLGADGVEDLVMRILVRCGVLEDMPPSDSSDESEHAAGVGSSDEPGGNKLAGASGCRLVPRRLWPSRRARRVLVAVLVWLAYGLVGRLAPAEGGAWILPLLLFVGAVAVGVKDFVGEDAGGEAVGRPFADAALALTGASLALLTAVVVVCPTIYLVPFLLIGSFCMGVSADVVLSQCRSKPTSRMLLWLPFGLIGCALCGLGSQFVSFTRAPLRAAIISVMLLLLAVVALRAGDSAMVASAANVVLSGEARVIAYLEGRGLGRLQAKIALLTAYGMSRDQISGVLYASVSTGSNYRSSAYKTLGVKDGRELADLLQRDAGFRVLSERGSDVCQQRAHAEREGAHG